MEKMEKRINKSRISKGINRIPFAKISFGECLRFNVTASAYFEKEFEKADVYYDEQSLKIEIIPNHNGEYSLVRPRKDKAIMVCIMAILTAFGNVNQEKRYEVTKTNNGVCVVLERA